MKLLSYDNEKDMRAMISDAVEFITSETKHTAEANQITDPNIVLLTMQALTLQLTTGFLVAMGIRREEYVREYERLRQQTEQSQDPGPNHLPINGPDFFTGHRRVKP